jgi:hypothetical protein
MTDIENKPLDLVYPANPAPRVRYASDEYGAMLQDELEKSIKQRSMVGKRRSVSDQFFGQGASRYLHFGNG